MDEDREQLVMTRIGGGRSALLTGAALAVLLAGGWLLLVLSGDRDESVAASPAATDVAAAGVPPSSTATASPEPPAVAPTPDPAAVPTPLSAPPSAPAVTQQLVVSFVTGERSYEIPLSMGTAGSFYGGTSLTYPLSLGAQVELSQVTTGRGAPQAVSAGSWPAVFYAGGGPERGVSILDYAEPARPALRELPPILRHGYQLVVTADGGHYPQLMVRLTIPHGLRLSRPGACEGGWRWSWNEDHC